MSCSHSLSALLANTQFAKDGPAMRRSKQASEKFAIASLNYRHQLAMDTVNTTSATMGGTISVVPQRDQPEFDAQSCHKVTDRGHLFDSFRHLCREYAMYTHDHTDVYNAIIFLFGTRTFASDAVPSDALAFVTSAAYIITVVISAGLNTNVPNNIVQKAAIAASIVSISDKHLKTIKPQVLAQNTRLWRHVYELLLIAKDKVSTVVTEITWVTMNGLTGIFQQPLRTPIDEFIEYVSNSKAIPTSSAAPLHVTARGEFVLNGNTYEASGYCLDGIILKKVCDGVADGVDMMEFVGLFTKTLDDYNAKDDLSICSGCSLQLVTENRRLYRYENSLCSADLTTAQNIEVHTDGTADFLAQMLLIDKRTQKVIRTGLRKHKCDLYDMHMLGGFDIKNCQKLSCLFEVSERAILGDVKCTGVSVWATIERMDNYEHDDKGLITRITHGKTTKYANQEGERVWWGCTPDGSALTIDDVVE